MRRRQFLVAAAGALAVAALPLYGPTQQVEDGYDQSFFQRVGLRVKSIVEEQGRGLRSLEIAPPEVVDGVKVRCCNLRLEAGASLLDPLYFIWLQPVR